MHRKGEKVGLRNYYWDHMDGSVTLAEFHLVDKKTKNPYGNLTPLQFDRWP